MGVNITTIANPKGFNHRNWVKHYFNGGGSPGFLNGRNMERLLSMSLDAFSMSLDAFAIL